MGVTRISPFE